MKNRFGKCIGGTHPQIKETNERHIVHPLPWKTSTISKILGLNAARDAKYVNAENVPLGSKNYTIKEEKELALIEKNLHYDQEAKRWIAEYPWIRDPKDLPDNKKAAFAKLISTERRQIQEQIQDMVNRGVARKLTKTEKKTTRTHKDATPANVQPTYSVAEVLTKRMILSQVNSIYDPLGLAGPYTVRAKILMRKLWTYETKLGLDDPIPEEYGREWMTFFDDLPEMEKITVKRCLKPHNAIGDPILIKQCLQCLCLHQDGNLSVTSFYQRIA